MAQLILLRGPLYLKNQEDSLNPQISLFLSAIMVSMTTFYSSMLHPNVNDCSWKSLCRIFRRERDTQASSVCGCPQLCLWLGTAPMISSCYSITFFFFFLATPRGMWNRSCWPGIRPTPPCIERWSLNHWTAREVPKMNIWKAWFLKLLRLILWQTRDIADTKIQLADRGWWESPLCHKLKSYSF